VAESSWTYKTTLKPIIIQEGEVATLCFGGLDTFATVYLRSENILKSDNMFHSHRVNITRFVRSHEPLELTIVFESAFKKARELKSTQQDHKWEAWNGDTARLAVRKAQFHW
jgi:beta-mannosidase